MLVFGGQMVWFGLILVVLVFVIFINATEKVKYGEFETPSWLLVTFGIYQWGQGLILAGFWMLFGLGCIFWWSPGQALSAYILFHMVRALIELFLLEDTSYFGFAHSIAPHTKKLTDGNRIQLYKLGQGIILLSGIIYLYVT